MAHKVGEKIGYFIVAFMLVTAVWGTWRVVSEIGWLKITLVSLVVATILDIGVNNNGA